jgi:hypothetical protein
MKGIIEDSLPLDQELFFHKSRFFKTVIYPRAAAKPKLPAFQRRFEALF